MARIPDKELERLKSEVSVERLVEGSGIELKRSGKDWVAKCPLHEDATASLVVTPAKNLWHCFGCGAAGGPIDWLMKTRGVSFRHAVELLREDMGVASLAARSAAKDESTPSLPVPPVAIARSTVKTLPVPLAFDADAQALLDQTVSYYHERLMVSPEASQYLMNRGLNHPELIKHFKLGVADRTLGLRLPEKNRKAGAQIRAQLTSIGVYRDSGHEHFNGSLVIPVFDVEGHVVEMYGRKLLDNLRAGTPKHLYLPMNEARGRGVFNIDVLKASKEIILCESLIDALTFWCAGYRHVTSAYGVEGLTEDIVQALKTHGVERVLIAYDRDEAGERGAAKAATRLIAEGMTCFRVQFPKGMDANEYALKVQPAAKSLGLVLRQAVWMGGVDRTAIEPTVDGLKSVGVPSLAAEPVPDAPPLEALPAVAAEPLPASPQPPAPSAEMACEVKDSEILLTIGAEHKARRYRVRGLSKNLSLELLKINLLVSCLGRGGIDSVGGSEAFYVDTLDLYSAKQRASYVAQASIELQVKEEVLKSDLGRVLMKLEALQEALMTKTLTPAPEHPPMSEAEHSAAMQLLKAHDLLERIVTDLSTCGLVGETTNKVVGYLASISRKLNKPLGIVVQSSSAAGKTSLMDAVLAFVPPEEQIKYSAMSGQSLFYMGEMNLKHKVLAIVEEEGANRASYALKLLQSEGELTMASTGKDPHSGNLVTQQYRVEGPVALILTTTATDLDEELMNRCLVLAVDEGREQTRAIHELQRGRRTLAGLGVKKERERLVGLHQNAQRLLKSIEVLNPYAQYLTFPDQATRLRRDHEKYLTLIDVVALLHQHQREIKSYQISASEKTTHIEYIEVTLADIAMANTIAAEVLGRSLDELPPQTRRLLLNVSGYVKGEAQKEGINTSEVQFTRKQLREALAWGDTQLRIHLERLVALEYVLMRREGAGGKYVYELVCEVDENQLQHQHQRVLGLMDVQAIAVLHEATIIKSRVNELEVAGQNNELAVQTEELAVRVRPESAPVAAGLHLAEIASNLANTGLAEVFAEVGQAVSEKLHCSDEIVERASYPQVTSYVQASKHPSLAA
jgi:DNA primase